MDDFLVRLLLVFMRVKQYSFWQIKKELKHTYGLTIDKKCLLNRMRIAKCQK